MFSVFGAFLLTALTLLLLAPEIRGRFVASTSTTASVLGRQQLLVRSADFVFTSACHFLFLACLIRLAGDDWRGGRGRVAD